MEKIIIIDFGSQYTQLIARKIRELNTYCEIHPYNKIPSMNEGEVKGVIFSGSPASVNQEKKLEVDLSLFRKRFPLLGICYGAQYLAYTLGGKVENTGSREYGRATLQWVEKGEKLFKGVSSPSSVWMSHGDTITSIPEMFHIIAHTESVQCAAYRIEGERTWGVQFHPEVYHTEYGKTILSNFLDICGCHREWTANSFIEDSIRKLKELLGEEKVVMALSGGVDSTVAATLLNRAIGENLTCVFVNNGLLRKNEYEEVLSHYKTLGLNVLGIDASQDFFEGLKGITDPEKKRKSIGGNFIKIFERECKRLNGVRWLAQGTIYPDVIESLAITGMVIKSHHNVGGLPKEMNLKIVEPLRLLFKDEVRRVGKELGLPESFINRHPFPGPGLGVRVLGEVTPERVKILQEADAIFISALREHKLYDKVWQAGVILLPIQSVGVMGDERTYENVVALRAVLSTDGMTANWANLPYEFLSMVSNEIINKVRGINRVVYDISSKPPATIEWE
ncbi:MAG TPA: GMP synthase (glutamine-hydrolyzing) [Porphyromonadaceae bacterium]|nr:GMP synthase (glutamine-hydrolyzing) [Porphyromonadaceae bacterium]